MTRRRYQQQYEVSKPIIYDTPLPIHLPIAIYYRQSSDGQIGNISTAMQTVDMASYLKIQGWDDQNILMIDMDAGVSGTTKIDERPGMSQLFALITTGKLGAVACQDEDRLFRDVTQIQVNIFIEACRQNKVLVITPSMVYNFSHEQLGVHHARQFRFKSEMAAEYINTIIKGRLQQARWRLQMAGRWAGAPVPTGYMVDMRKELPGGTPNPNWRKFAIFEPYAEVVRAYWSIFLECGGQIHPTARHIWEHGPYYPDPNICVPPDGFQVNYAIRQYKGKWCPASRPGLARMLTNAAYLGHWMVKGGILIWNHHPAIVESDVFMRAFDYLSPVSLDGRPNERFAPVQVFAQPSKVEERKQDWPLLAGLLFSQDTNGEWLRVGVQWNKTNETYLYRLGSKAKDTTLWYKKAILVDEVVVQELLDKLEATFDFDAWEQAVAGLAAQVQEEKSLKETQLKQLLVIMENLVASLDTLQHPQMIQAAEKRYADAQLEVERLRRELARQETETDQVQQIRMLRESCTDIFQSWPNLSCDEQRQVLNTFVNRVEVTPVLPNGLDLLIQWKDGSASSVSIVGKAGPHLSWTQEENQRLITLMDSGADQLTIAAAFPDRTWTALYIHYLKLVKPEARKRARHYHIMDDYETYNEYVMRTGGEHLTNMTFEVSSDRCCRC
jgi:DNA invertase Pin-like site-specific DNA recombinase